MVLRLGLIVMLRLWLLGHHRQLIEVLVLAAAFDGLVVGDDARDAAPMRRLIDGDAFDDGPLRLILRLTLVSIISRDRRALCGIFEQLRSQLAQSGLGHARLI